MFLFHGKCPICLIILFIVQFISLLAKSNNCPELTSIHEFKFHRFSGDPPPVHGHLIILIHDRYEKCYRCHGQNLKKAGVFLSWRTRAWSRTLTLLDLQLNLDMLLRKDFSQSANDRSVQAHGFQHDPVRLRRTSLRPRGTKGFCGTHMCIRDGQSLLRWPTFAHISHSEHYLGLTSLEGLFAVAAGCDWVVQEKRSHLRVQSKNRLGPEPHAGNC